MYSNGFQSYRKTNVITADPKRLVLMCYEDVDKDYEGKATVIKKAQDIINELMCSLDFEKGGSIAGNLESLYNYMTRRIIYADVNRDVGAIDEVIGMFNELKSAWEEAFYGQAKETGLETMGFDEGSREVANCVSV
ncbi:MAG: flagellar export chaperone FliS [Deltaproteobacteria bacterium]|nr:flagellar export chaperone FliS [Deltaproteobacteria bacterium]